MLPLSFRSFAVPPSVVTPLSNSPKRTESEATTKDTSGFSGVTSLRTPTHISSRFRRASNSQKFSGSTANKAPGSCSAVAWPCSIRKSHSRERAFKGMYLTSFFNRAATWCRSNPVYSTIALIVPGRLRGSGTCPKSSANRKLYCITMFQNKGSTTVADGDALSKQ